jgi:superfamily II DNA/RNA helicase
MPAFKDLGLSESTLEALSHLGYTSPTPIQEQAIPPLLEGRDVIGQAQTGTGKTAAFGLPMVEYADPSDPNVQALVLTPTRELCIQVTQALRAYGAQKSLNVVAIFGGAPIRDQATRLKDSQIVVGTVGRVMDMISRHHLFLDDARYVILDEADEMLDLGFLTWSRSCDALRWVARRLCSAPLCRPRSGASPTRSCTTPSRSRCAPRRSRSTRSPTSTWRCRTARSPMRSCVC